MSFRSRIRQRAAELYDFCCAKGYNTRISLIVDLSRYSGLCRFVVWSYEQDRALLCCPVSHGSGSKMPHKRSAYARVSNDDGSHLSSVGRALVAERYEGRYGVAYRLDGLDVTNDNLRSRCVVLHGWSYTPSYPIFPLATVGSFGCPVLSRRNMSRVDEILKNESRVVLLSFLH